MTIEIPRNLAQHTKREILSKLASVYVAVGFVLPVHLLRKVVYPEIRDLELAWEKIIANQLIKVWQKWESTLPYRIKAQK